MRVAYFSYKITKLLHLDYKETTEAAMFDSIDQTEYQKNGNIKTNAETYVVCFDIAYTNGTLKASMPFKADVYFTPNNGDIQVKKIYKD